MIYFLYYTYGSCNDGDHSWGLERFPTEEDASRRAEEIQNLWYDAQIVIIKGDAIKEFDYHGY